MQPGNAGAVFPTTQWTAVVNGLASAGSQERQAMLGLLCSQYWYPLYAFARRAGSPPEDAEDLTQGFFAYAIEHEIFCSANRDLGKLRTFLLRVFQRYCGGIRAKHFAEKRGGRQEIFSLDLTEGESWFESEAPCAESPETLFDRSWARAVLRSTLAQLSLSEEAAGRGEQFQEFRVFLTPENISESSYEASANRMGLREDAVRQAVSRLRKRFGELLRCQIAGTLQGPTPATIEDELKALKAALRG